MGLGSVVFSVVPAVGYGLALPGRGPRKKTAPNRLIEHPVRRKLVEAIMRLKGLNEVGLKEESGVARGTLRHHLALLEKHGVIRKVSLGREIHYFLSGADAETAETFARIRNGRTGNVLKAVLVSPGIRQKDLAERVGMTRKVLGVHLAVLNDGQLIQEYSRGRLRRYYPGQKVDGQIWGLFGLEKPVVAQVQAPRGISEYRGAWFLQRAL